MYVLERFKTETILTEKFVTRSNKLRLAVVYLLFYGTPSEVAMHYNCQECTRLWNEYALATRHYLKVEGKLRTATDARDEVAIEQLSPFVNRAAAERARLKKEIDLHEENRLARHAHAAST
jgi:hypothetical protein